MRHASRSLAHRSPHFLLAALSAAVLAACGGGGGDATSTDTGAGGGGGGSGGGGVTPTALTVSGVAARGAALAGASVQASCATGSGSATALPDGSYSLPITGGVLPCVLKATSSDGTTTLYSLAAGTGATATANITPLTELVLAQMTGQEPAAFYANASTDATALTTAVTAEKIDAASTAVVATLQAAGVDTSGITSIVSGSLSAGTGAGYDGVLDTLGTTLASTGTTLGDLVTTVATTSAATSSGGTTTTSGSEATAGSMLPAALLLKAKAPTCGALRSTDYRFIVVKASSNIGPIDPVQPLDAATMDAVAAAGPTFTYGDGSTDVLAPVAGEACHFTSVDGDGGTADIVVAPSGVIVARSSQTWNNATDTRDTSMRMVIALPKQTLSVADLAGSWNGLGWEAITGGAQVDPGIVTVAADGALSFKCTDNNAATAEVACTTDGPYTGLTANADGGFDLTINDPAGTTTQRAFAYRAGNGNTVVVTLHADGTVHLLTPYRTLTAPAVGDAHKAWNIALNSGWVAGDALQYNSFAITGVDAAAGTFTRDVTSVATGVTHAQTLALNTARNGWMHRAAGTAPGSDGSTVTVREMYTLKLGIGISAYWLPAANQAGTNARFALSVTQP
jgi:hypothetical protein